MLVGVVRVGEVVREAGVEAVVSEAEEVEVVAFKCRLRKSSSVMKLEEDFRSGVVKHTQIFPVSKNAILHVSRVFLVAGMHS